MSRGRDVEKGAFFQKIILLMSFFLILLFIIYEFLDAPPRGFVLMKISGFEKKQQEASLQLVLSNNSSDRREGILLVLLGYEESRVTENTTYYRFTEFKAFNSSMLTLNPGEEKTLGLSIVLDPGAKRIVVIYCYDSNHTFQTSHYDSMVLRRDKTIWVQTWLN
ncbi:MAG: hypothetical protein FGF53_09095 [Candidatus Brockarchaeota archaeon]|nr:hypothetical protein [Candidatus Brockarchaeota archaeon]